MKDETVIEPIDEEDVEETVVTQVKEKSPKTYSEDAVQKLIRERVAREKASSKQIRDELDLYRTSTEAELAQYKTLLEKGIEERINLQPDSIKMLLEKLTVVEKIEWLSKPENQPITKRTIPETPEGKDKSSKQEQTLPLRF